MPANLAGNPDMKIIDATAAWDSVTLSADEIWQVHDGVVLVDTDATEADRAGIRLFQDDSIQFTDGTTVYYRLASGTSAIIARVAI
jgi:hypothetical protein